MVNVGDVVYFFTEEVLLPNLQSQMIQFGFDVLRDGAAEWRFRSEADLSAFVLERFGIRTSFLQVKPKCTRQGHRLPSAPPLPSITHRLSDSGECLAMWKARVAILIERSRSIRS